MSPSSPLRVAYLIGSLDLGGSERQMLAVALRLPRERFDVHFFLLTHRGPLAAVAEAAGIRVTVLGWRRPLGVFAYARWSAQLFRFGLTFRAGKYDILDAWLFHAYAIAAITRPVARVPVFVAGRRSLSDHKNGFKPLYRLVDAWARRSADAIVANSPQVRDDVIAYEGLAPSRVRVIRNGVEILRPMTESDRAARRAAWGFGPDDIVLGCVANYKRLKGLESLIRATAALKPDLPRLRLVLVGEGGLRPILEQMVADLGLTDDVRLHGHEPDARSLYGAFDIAVLASETEGLPNVLLEAAAAARPIVATAAGGAADIVVDGETGILVPIRDDSALASAVRRLAIDPELREALGQAAQRRVATTFGMDRFVAETAALYEELSERRRSRRLITALLRRP